jgi:hypothetical protein
MMSYCNDMMLFRSVSGWDPTLAGLADGAGGLWQIVGVWVKSIAGGDGVVP